MDNKMIPSLKVPLLREAEIRDNVTPIYVKSSNQEKGWFRKRDKMVPPPVIHHFLDDDLDNSPYCLYHRAMNQQRKRSQRVRTIIYGSAILSFTLGAIVGWNFPIF